MPLPDEETEIELNVLDHGRYKPHFEKLLALLPADTVGFAAGVYDLCYLNYRNPLMPQIYYEAAKQLGELVREPALHLYLHYLHYGSERKWNFKPKPFTKRLQKKLFPQPEHQERFETICQKLLRYQQLERATAAVAKVYAQERRKIALDTTAIQATRNQHADTVELLNEYLRDDDAPAPAKTPATRKKPAKAPAPTSAAAVATQAAAVPPAAAASDFVPGLGLSATHQALLRLFAAHGLALPQTAVEAFVKTHGALRNQLIDSLNERCYNLFDDVLIEESDDGYTIYEAYYQQLIG